MKINWITRCKDWAFMHIAQHFSKAMPEHEHVIDEDSGDVNYVCSPNHFKHFKANDKTILHIDSNRWYEVFLQKGN